MIFCDDDTVPYDMITYAHVSYRMDELHLFCLWTLTPLKNGVMLNLSRFDGEQERMFLQSSSDLDLQLDNIVSWATTASQLKSTIPPKKI